VEDLGGLFGALYLNRSIQQIMTSMEETRVKIRYGLVLALALGLGVAGCASGGGGGGAAMPGGGGSIAATGAGESPRNTTNTRAAENALEEAESASDPAQATAFYQQAMTAAELAIAEDMRNPLAHRLAALAAMGLEDYQAAGAHFDRAVELRPLYEFDLVGIRERAWIDLYQEATPFVQSGDYAGAVPFFEGANAIYDGRPEAIITLGQLYAQLGDHERALSAMDQAIAFGNSEKMAEMAISDSVTARGWEEQIAEVPMLRAQVLAAAGRFEEAETAFRTLVAQNPDDLALKRSLGQILTETGDEAGAAAVYEDILAMPGLTAEDMYIVGVGYYQMSDYGRAADAFAGAAGVSPNDRDALEMWARSLQIDSVYTEVPPIARRWAELDPNSQNAWLVLAQAANATGDQATTQEAIQAVDALDVVVNDLQLRRFAGGGAQVNGSVINKKLIPGASVTLTFTFYSSDGSPLGTVTETAEVGQIDMAELFNVQFDSAERVDGYGYELTVN